MGLFKFISEVSKMQKEEEEKEKQQEIKDREEIQRLKDEIKNSDLSKEEQDEEIRKVIAIKNHEVIHREYKKWANNNLYPRDGKIHTLMLVVNSYNYDKYINGLLIHMQDDSYEIIDIKFNVVKDANNSTEYHVLITYKNI